MLKGVSFASEENKITSILGPNGAGKTTLLKCMCGLYKPTSGEITVDGRAVTDISSKELAKCIAFVPQSVPSSRMTVFDTVLLGRKPYIEWSATSEDIDKVSETIDSLGMGPLSLKYMDQISGGEFQKAHIARAIVQEPSVLILDEPSNNLDIANQHRTMRMISKAVHSRGMCTIMTMHDINLAVHYSDHFLFLSKGRVAAYGGPEIITNDLIRDVYDMDVDVIDYRGLPLVAPSDSERYASDRI